MSIRMTRERPFFARAHRSTARRHKLLLFFLAALLSLNAACSSKQAAIQSGALPVCKEPAADVVAHARSNIGVPYRFGGMNPETGFDCSGFVCWSYEQVGVKLPRRAREQANFGTPVRSRAELQPGDIVAFKGTRSRTGWHSGIYTGNGMFIHSPNKGKTVTEDSLDDAYYAKRYYGACRIPQDGSSEQLYVAYLEKTRAEAASAKKGRAAAAKKGGATAGKKGGAAAGKKGGATAGKKADSVADRKSDGLAAKKGESKTVSAGSKNKSGAKAGATQRKKAGTGKTPERTTAAKAVKAKSSSAGKNS